MSRHGMPWSEEELAILREFYQKMPLEELAKKLPGRTLTAIERAANRRGIKKNRSKVHEFLTPAGLRRFKKLVEKHKTSLGESAGGLGECAGCPYPHKIGRRKYGCYWPTCLRDDLRRDRP